MALIELKSNLNTKIGETNTTKNGTFSVNQRNNTEKNTQFTNDQVSAQHKKFKPDDDQLITHDIGDGYKGTNKDGGFTRGGFILNTDRQVEDTKRLRKFLTTPKGFLFQTKQGILQKKNAREETRRYDRTSIIRNVDSVTEILDGNVSRAGETRHRDRGNYESQTKNTGITGSKHLNSAGGFLQTESTLDQIGSIPFNSSYQTEFGTSLQNRFGRRTDINDGNPGGNKLSYETREDFFNVGGEENTKTGEVSRRQGWGGDPDRKQGIKDAVAYLTPGDATLFKGAPFGSNKVKPKSLQVLYGGEFGKLDQLPKTNQKGNRADLTDKSSNDFIKFRIRDAVNGKWIIFPALITGITDNSQANYSKIQYIGRPDSVHVYQNFNRSISFNLKVLATNENELGIVWQKVSALKGLTQPSFKPFFYDNKKIKSTGEKFTRPTAPYVYLTIGDMFKNTPGYFESVNVTIPEAASWEIIEGAQFPHMCDISCTFQYIGRELPATTSINYDGLKPGISGQNSVIRDVIPIGEFEGAI